MKFSTHHNQLDCETLDMATKQIEGMVQVLMNVPDTGICRKREYKPNRIFQTALHSVDELYKLLCVLVALTASSLKSFESMKMNPDRWR